MAKSSKKKEEVSSIGTKEVAELLGIDGKKLRAIIRDENIFGDQRNVRYTFSGPDDPKIDLIREAIEKRAAKKSEAEDDDKGKGKSKSKGKGKGKSKLKKGRKPPADDDDEEEDDE